MMQVRAALGLCLTYFTFKILSSSSVLSYMLSKSAIRLRAVSKPSSIFLVSI